MAKFSILIPFMPRRPRQAAPFAELVSRTHATRLWQGQALLAEPHQTFVHLAATGVRVPAGIGVSLMPLRHPYEAALQARSVAQATGAPMVAGFGPGGKSFQTNVLGAPYRSQLTAVREYLTLVRSFLDGKLVEFRGEYFNCNAQLPLCPAPPVEVGLGVLRPGAARVAGEVADAAITWLTPASYIRDVIRPALEEGAQAAGRAVPRIVAIVPVAFASDDRDLADLVIASSGAHLNAPHYRDMLRRAGVDLPSGDPRTTAKATAAGGAFLYGAPDEVLERVCEFLEVGVDEVVLNVTGVRNLISSAAAEQELEQLLQITEPLVSSGRSGRTT
jgi:alkanesulfonate monooxygenase SsuD/methylene tetrahydromethanopterin reductase-like flavin-dependent oxidoreductase (luciferase family)